MQLDLRTIVKRAKNVIKQFYREKILLDAKILKKKSEREFRVIKMKVLKLRSSAKKPLTTIKKIKQAILMYQIHKKNCLSFQKLKTYQKSMIINKTFPLSIKLKSQCQLMKIYNATKSHLLLKKSKLNKKLDRRFSCKRKNISMKAQIN